MFFKPIITLIAAAAFISAPELASPSTVEAQRAQAAGADAKERRAKCRRARAERPRNRRAVRRACRRSKRRPPARVPRRPFAPTSFWNTPLADDAPIDARSSGYVGRLRYLLRRWAPYVNTTSYSTPVYTVPADQPTVRVTLDKENSEDLQAVFDEVPIPRGARPAAGTDGHMVVWQPSRDVMWEFWVARRLADGWHARYGGRMTNVSKSPGYYTAIRGPSGRYVEHPLWGATATSLPLLGGLIRIDELRAGRIDHALSIALPEIRAGAYSWPAQRTDGAARHPNAIPEGARLRLDPRLDLSKLDMPPVVRTIAVAAQRYGIVVRDGGGAVTFFAEDPTPTGRDPFAGPDGLFGVRYIDEALRAFPWDRLQVLKTSMTYVPPKGILSGNAD